MIQQFTTLLWKKIIRPIYFFIAPKAYLRAGHKVTRKQMNKLITTSSREAIAKQIKEAQAAQVLEDMLKATKASVTHDEMIKQAEDLGADTSFMDGLEKL